MGGSGRCWGASIPLVSLLTSSGEPERLLLLGLSGDEAPLELSDEVVGLTL
jgi:hypothetical protein